MFRITPNGKKEEAPGLLLLDTVLPDELEGETSTTPAREIFELLRDACLGKLNNTMIKNDGTVVPINGAAYNVALRMQNSPKAAEIVIALVSQYLWLRNQHTKRLIRSAMQIIKASHQPIAAPVSQPAEADDDINDLNSIDLFLAIEQVEATDNDWASVVAVTGTGEVVATIANGSIFNPHAVSEDKKLKDTQVKSIAEALERFAEQLANPAPALLAKLQRIRDIAVDKCVKLQARVIMEEMSIVDGDFCPGRKMRMPINRDFAMQQANLVADAVRRLSPTSTPPSAIKEYGVLPARFKHRITLTVANPGTDKTIRVWSHLPAEEYLVRIGGVDMEDNSYTGEPLAAPEPLFISSGWRQKANGRWHYEIRHRKPSQIVPDDDEETHIFRHRTRYADGRIHGEESNMRFGQHDEEFFQMSLLDEIEHKLAMHDADRWTMDLTMMDGSVDLGVAKFLTQQIDDGIRRRSSRSSDDARSSDTADPTRPNWWKRTVDARKKAERTIKIMEPAVVAGVVLKEEHRYGKHVIITTWERKAKVTTIYAHMEEIVVTAGQHLKAGDVIGKPEPPLILPAKLAAEVSTVKDCKIKRFGPNGALLEGWVVPTNYQLAGVRRTLMVAERGRIYAKAEQQARNNGDCWEYPNVTASAARLPMTGENLPILRKPKAAPQMTWPQPVGPAHRYFTADSTWHEPLPDDDTRHVIVTLNDSEHALARLVATLIQ